MKLYGAIDLHSSNSVLVVIDEEDKIVYQKRLPNDLALILKEFCVSINRILRGSWWSRRTIGTGWSMV